MPAERMKRWCWKNGEAQQRERRKKEEKLSIMGKCMSSSNGGQGCAGGDRGDRGPFGRVGELGLRKWSRRANYSAHSDS